MGLPNVAAKTNRVIHIILVAFFVVAFRVWHLGVVQREDKLLEAAKPKTRTILSRAERGVIYDRFRIPLAINRICYNAAIYYGQIAQIPISAWETRGDGTRIRMSPRKEHVANLSAMLSPLLGIEAQKIEDLIHAKASLLPHVPYVLKGNLTEREYYHLKMLEKDWLGLHAEIGSERHYPQGKVGCHILGTLGSISQREYEAIAGEMGALREAVQAFEQGWDNELPPGYSSFDAVYARLYELKERAYTLGDRVGKGGIEEKFEEDLRGFWGLKTFEVDQKGQAVREIPGGKAPIPGKEVMLSISAELQQFAEELLCKSEREREGRSMGLDRADQVRKVQKQPWIKGGAIVALDPVTGEVLACASYPRFDPNDFIGHGKQGRVERWLESSRFLGALWEGREPLLRERWMGRQVEEEKTFLSWDYLLDQLLPSAGPLKELFHRADDIKSACAIQEDFEGLLYFAGADAPFSSKALEAAPYLRRLEGWLGPLPEKDKLFAVDLCRLAVNSARFSDELLGKMGGLKLSAYLGLNQAFHRLEKRVRGDALQEFHSGLFSSWRKENQKEFLAQKRREEKEKKTYARPFIDYLDQEEARQFQLYWEERRFETIVRELSEGDGNPDKEALRRALAPLSDELACEFLRTFRSFDALDRPLFSKSKKQEKDLVSFVLPKGGYGAMRSYAFQAGSPQGSLFKLVSGYEGLRQGHHLSLIDEVSAPGKAQVVAYSANKTPYPRIYKGGRLPRSSARNIGKIDLIGALEHSSNSYFSILAGDFLKHPEDLNEAARAFGLGSKSGIQLPKEAAGNLPKDLQTNRTGLYSYAIGQHTLLVTPLQTALMLSSIANGGHLLVPKIVARFSGMTPSTEPFSPENLFARKELDAIGIPFPLFTSAQKRAPLPCVSQSSTETKYEIPLSTSVRHTLLEGMDRSVWGSAGSARPALIKSLIANPLLMRDYLSLQHLMIGKTGTAEILYNACSNPSSLPEMYKHIWFGAIHFDANPLMPASTRWEHPDIVVTVFLRFGDAGREAAPLAAQVIHKWRELKSRHQR